jgi:hypothetical protein
MSLCFNKSDFQQIQYSYIFVNQTSGTEFRNYKEIKVEELFEKGLVLIVPTSSCNISHNLLLMMFKGRKVKVPKRLPADGQGKGIYYSAIGKIQSKTLCEKDEKYSIIKLSFVQYDKYRWDDILVEYKEKQKEISNLMKSMQINEE